MYISKHCILLVYGELNTDFKSFSNYLEKEYKFNTIVLPTFNYTTLKLEIEEMKQHINKESTPILNEAAKCIDSLQVIYPIHTLEQMNCFKKIANAKLVRLQVPNRTRYLNFLQEYENKHTLDDNSNGVPTQNEYVVFSDTVCLNTDYRIFENMRTEYSFSFKCPFQLENQINKIHSFVRLVEGSRALDRSQYFLRLAYIIKKRSNCMKRSVGAVLVKNNQVIGMGYNGTPYEMKNCFDDGCERCNNNTKQGIELDQCLCLHAEQSAILEAGTARTTGADIYVTAFPCLECAKIILTAVILKEIGDHFLCRRL